ncbi:hypothetical protein CKAH01_09392 [Colletotrichum kahawae]|uniref:Uncharacterized protein n=1 Tax=Colletotrichum kahawae TaxID=34407 RepID=A0AAD9Y0F0_COLKA|nr:hypothetical protein CKAH01_09392 [Colletotrichum kahawae]
MDAPRRRSEFTPCSISKRTQMPDRVTAWVESKSLDSHRGSSKPHEPLARVPTPGYLAGISAFKPLEALGSPAVSGNVVCSPQDTTLRQQS